MKTRLRRVLLTVLVSGLAANLAFGQGTNVSLDFETDPEDLGVQFFGTAEWIDPGFAFDGNGYLKVTDAVGSQRGAIVFPDLSDPPGTSTDSFFITAELRVGDGTGSPADGFSFNFVRLDDPVLDDGEGWATGPHNEANLPEEGTTTGLGIGFDEWQSGGATNPPCLPSDASTDPPTFTNDCIGLSVRVDNQLLAQVNFPTLNGAVDDPTSLQTGPIVDNSGEGLGWAKLVISVTPTVDPNDGLSNLSVTYKGVTAIDQPVPFVPSAGRLVFGGRTGGSHANHHIDNIEISADIPFPDPGDFNDDGVVDLQDFTILTGNMNTIPGLGILGDYQAGDINSSGEVNLADFVQFRQVYADANNPAAAAVPEPSSTLLGCLGCLALLVMRRRRS